MKELDIAVKKLKTGLMQIKPISNGAFEKIQKIIFDWVGINLSKNKRAMVSGRLMKRLRFYQIDNYDSYLDIVTSKDARFKEERQTFIDLITTNETYFFREPAHFDFLVNDVFPKVPLNSNYRIWSAACSTGEEVYTLAMLANDHLTSTKSWEIIGTDINTDVVKKSRQGIYTMTEKGKLDIKYLKKYCLKGMGKEEGNFVFQPFLKEKITFMQANLNGHIPEVGKFDLIFLRNVMIYFNNETKAKLIERLTSYLKVNGYLIIGLSETLFGMQNGLLSIGKSIYKRVS